MTGYRAELDSLAAAAGDWPDYVIPAQWWEWRPVLSAIHAWATARLTPPEILLAHVLAEMALRTPATIVLPPIIGAPAALNIGVVNVAETGVGKTTGGRGLLRSATGTKPSGDSWPLGTGEGLVDFLLDKPDDDGERRPHGRPIMLHADEGRVLEDLAARTGSTLISVLCSAISGAEIGQGNATKNLRRRVPALEYRVAIVLNLQPVYLRGLLADIDGGLPQRFLFVSGTGHHLTTLTPEPVHPLRLPTVDITMFTSRTGANPTIAVPAHIRAAIQQAHLDRLHAQDRGEPVAGGSHRNLLHLRVAALLAILDGRAAISDEDWDLAEAPVLASDATIARGDALRAEQARAMALAEEHKVARHAVAASVAVETNAFDRLARKVTRLVWAEPGTTRRDIRSRLSQSQRGIVDDAVEIAITKGWLVEQSESGQGQDRRVLYPGEVRP